MKTYEELNLKISTLLDNLSLIVASNLAFRIGSMQTSGMSQKEIRNILLADLVTGGRLFGQLKNGVKRISKNAIEEAGNLAAMRAFEQKGYKEYKWITVGKNICPDCKTRHGDTGDISYFSTIGLPKSGFSVCEHNCNCQLVPVEYKGENLENPIKYKYVSEGNK
tara:strand:- start:1729 stop:2223 length:495 start_codon:yes stop_codon:yes gene_type:complete